MIIEDKRAVANPVPLSDIKVGETFERDDFIWIRCRMVEGQLEVVCLNDGWLTTLPPDTKVIPVSAKIVIEY